MTQRTTPVALATLCIALLGAVLLTGCGSSSKASSSEAAAAADDIFTTTSLATGTSAGNVDVCALLSQSDASDVARAEGLDGAQTDATVYTLTATKQDTSAAYKPISSCKFTIQSSGAQGTVVFQVQDASNFSLYSDGTKIDGLGDEAYDGAGNPVVRKGGLMISPGEDSLTDTFTIALLRKMVPNLK